MIIDSSALVAIILDEPEGSAFAGTLRTADLVGIGAPTLVETAIVLTRRIGADASKALDDVLQASRAVIIDFDAMHWREAVRAWELFGKGRHRARLNMGDCLAYATAKVARRPLLAKGDDFRHTDIELVPLAPVR